MKRALISVYDKTGIVDFARELENLGFEIVSTGGTFSTLEKAGIKVIEVEDVTKFPEILNGRVKTLNPLIHGGILYRRDNQEDIEIIEKMDISPIDIVVNNLYPFEETIQREGVSETEIIENIDIGGPSMIRAAAKNFLYVTTVIDPKDYITIIKEIEEFGDTTLNTRKYLARKVFNYTAYYDTLISNYFNEAENIKFPEYLTIGFRDKVDLRYGENPHQEASFYKESKKTSGSIAQFKQLHGKELSFNNINDSNGALEALKLFDEPTVVAVKHSNPCGIGSADNILDAYRKAYDSDPISIFGGIIAINREVNRDVANEISKIFVEVVMAPSFTKEALDVLKEKKNIRLLEIKDIDRKTYSELDMKKVMGGFLVQDRDEKIFDEKLEYVTDKKPTKSQLEDLEFAWKVAKVIKSNGVAIVKDKATIGIGLGEVNRVWAVENAIERSGKKVEGAVIASDGFFPFKDSIEAMAKANISAIIQPGGSIRDEEVIEEANNNDISMVFTGIRHFKH